LVERFDVALELDAVDEIDRHGHVLLAQQVQERVLQKLAFVAHDMLRVANGKVPTLSHRENPEGAEGRTISAAALVERVLAGAEFDPHRRADELEMVAETALEKTLVRIG